MSYNENTNQEEVAVAAEEVEGTKKERTHTKKGVSPSVDQTAEIEALKAQLEQMTKLMAAMMAGNSSTVNNNPINSLNEEIKIIHLIDNPIGITTHIELSNISIDFTAFGEERTLDRRQAEELAGKKRDWFERGIIAFGNGSEEFAKRFALKTVKDYSYMNPQFLEHIATLNAIQLEELYNKLAQGHREFLIGYFKRKILEGKDPRFTDPQKIEMLDRVTRSETYDHRGAMENVVIERAAQKK